MRLAHKSEVYKAKAEFKKLKDATVYKENGEFLSLETDQLLLMDKELIADYYFLFKEVCEHFDLLPKPVKENKVKPLVLKQEPLKVKPVKPIRDGKKGNSK